MKRGSSRRRLLVAAGTAWLAARADATDPGDVPSVVERAFAAIEASSGGRLGVAASATAGRVPLPGWRAGERFPLCSTFKPLAVAAVLRRSEREPRLLGRRLAIDRSELVPHSPVTEPHAGGGMTVDRLCAAALQQSDNTSASLLLRLLGGSDAVTAFARSIGDREMRLDRSEPELNSASPGDPRDTTTPAAMAADLQTLLLDHALGAGPSGRLEAWMRGNATGDARIRARVPSGWPVADKTGSGDYGTTNDVALIRPPGRPPIVLAVYFTQAAQDAALRDDVIAAAARVVIDSLEADRNPATLPGR